MKKYIFINVLIAAIISSGYISCKKQLVILPRQSIDAGSALTSREAIDASITGIYARLKSARWYGRDLIGVAEALSDNGFATNKSGRLLPEAQNTQGSSTGNTNHFTTSLWTSGLPGVNQCNLTLEAIPKLPAVLAITAAESNKWQGQLYFMRAMFYFEMMKAYAYIPGTASVVASQDRGGIPIILNGISSVDSALAFFPSRPAIDAVYAQIIADLTIANSKLTVTDAVAGVASCIGNKAAAQALLARANLYIKNYAEAKRWSDSSVALSGSRLTNTSSYVASWRVEHNPEALFQVRFATSAENIGVNESLQTSFTTLIVAGDSSKLGGFGDLVPTLTLLTDLGIALTGGMTTTNFALPAFVASRSGDVRNLIFEKGNNGRGNPKIECTKFLGKSGFINLDNAPVIRIAETYLTRAEAQCTTGSPVFDPAAALADLKYLKSRRIVGYTGSALETADNALTPVLLYEEILRQRRIELAFEGQRFFDLKRLGRDLIKTPHYNNVAFTDARILAPIFQQDVDGNPNLKQNFGY